MNFELTDRAKDYVERVTAFMDERDLPGRAGLRGADARGGRSALPPADPRGAQGGGALARAVEPLPPAPRVGPGSDERGVRAAGRDHGPLAAPGARGDELQRSRHREHGGPDALRHRGAQGALAASAAGRRDPLGVRHDRAGRRVVGRHQHRDAHRARRRRVRHQRPQVVDVQRPAPQLQGPDRHGQDRSGRPQAPPAVDARRADRHAGRDDRPRPAGLRLPGPRGPRGGALRGRARAGERAAGRRGRRLHDLPGPPRARAHPSLHALDRHGRARARPACAGGPWSA